MKEVLRYPKCFVCGDKNIHGIQAKFYYDGEKASTEITASDKFEGYQGVYHGGVIASLLDEVMVKAILAQEIIAVTREMTLKYFSPVRVGDKLIFTGKIIKSKGALFLTEGEVKDSQGKLYASASGKYLAAKDELKSELMKSVE